MMRSPLRSWRRGWGHHAGGTQQHGGAASGRAPPKRPPPVPSPHGLRSHLHDDVEGEVEEQVADADGQQVGSKVIGVDNEAVGSAGEAGTGSGVSSACGVPPRALLSPGTCWQLPQGMGRCRGTLRCRGCRGRAQPTAATSWVSSAPGAGPGPGGSRAGAAAGMGGSGCGGSSVGARLCTHSDQLMMFPMTKSTIRSCQGRGDGVRRGPGGHPARLGGEVCGVPGLGTAPGWWPASSQAATSLPLPSLTTYMGPLHCRTQSVYSTCRILRRMPESVGTGEVEMGVPEVLLGVPELPPARPSPASPQVTPHRASSAPCSRAGC